MFQKSSHDAPHADVMTQSAYARAQRTHAANNKFNLHSACDARYSALNDVLIQQSVHLGNDAGRLPFPRMFRFAIDQERRISARSSGATSNGS